MARVEALEGFREDAEVRLRVVERTAEPTAKRVDDHETRLRGLESQNMKFAGAIGVLSVFGSAVGAAIVKLVLGG